MTKVKISILCLIIVSLCTIISTKQTKCLEGTPILTRTRVSNSNNFQLKYQCLCPIDFLGHSCRFHRNIRCYLTKRGNSPLEINRQNFKESMTVSLQVNAECFIQQDMNKYVPLLRFLIERQRHDLKLDFELESGMVNGVKKIVWANNSNIFYSDGRLKPVEGFNYSVDRQNRSVMSEQDEQKYLDQYKPTVQYVYKSKFLGVPMSDSSFYVTTNVLRPIQNRINNNKQPLIWSNEDKFMELMNKTSPSSIQKASQYFQGFSLTDLLEDDFWDKIKDKIKNQKQTYDLQTVSLVPYFQANVTIRPEQAAQFQNIRIQASIIEYYEQNIYTSQTGVNSVEFIVPLKVPGMAEAKVYSVNFNKKQISRWTYFIIGLVLFGIGYFIFALRRRKIRQRRVQIQQSVQEKDQYVPWK